MLCRRDHLEHAEGNPSAPSGQLPLHKGAFFSRDTQPPASPQAPPIRTSKGQSTTAPERPTCFVEGQRGDAQEGNTSWVLFGSFSQRERTITFPTLQQSCRQPQSTILSQCSQVHTAQVTPLKLSRHTPAACGESQNPQALPQNIPSQSPSVTALPEGEPRGLQMSGCAEHAAGNPSAPSGQLPLHKGAVP